MNAITETAESQGWTTTTLVALLLNFIAEEGLEQKLINFLEESCEDDEEEEA